MSSSSAFVPENLKLLITTLSSLITIKLDSSNFIIWRTQVQNFLHASSLFGYLDGTIPAPSPITKDAAGKEVVNDAYLQWKVIDSHLLSCLTATLTTAVFSTSREVWLALEKRFTTLSRSHIHQLKDRLSTVQKGTKSMENYLKEVKDISDQLAIAACPVHDEDLVFHILHGLPSVYDAFKTSVRTRSGAISVEELTSLLCSEAIHIDSASKSSTSGDLTVAFSTNVTRNSSFRGGFNSYQNSSFPRGRVSYRGNYRGTRSNFRGGRSFGQHFRPNSSFGSFSGGQTVTCQICQKPGHTAVTWYRHDNQFTSQPGGGSPVIFAVPSSQPGHNAISSSQSSPRAYAAATSVPPSPDWYLDSAATHNLTNDLSNMSFYQPYHGADQVQVGNGAFLPIQHSGQGHTESPV